MIFDEIPQHCRSCEILCGRASLQCGSQNTCIGLNAMYLAVFSCLFIYSVYYSWVFFRKVNVRGNLMLKRTVFVLSTIYSTLRVIRYAMILGLTDNHTSADMLVETALYWFAILPLFAIFCFLVLSWFKLCVAAVPSLKQTWLGRKYTLIFIIACIVVTVLTIFVIIGYGTLSDSSINNLVLLTNILTAAGLTALSIATVIGSHKIKHLSDSMILASTKYSLLKLNLHTRIVAVVQLINILVLLIASGFYLVFPTSWSFCLTRHVLYRIGEVAMMLFVTFRLRIEKERAVHSEMNTVDSAGEPSPEIFSGNTITSHSAHESPNQSFYQEE
mmetsp:Transcript_1850/g.2386  ORF Transcript_1850/g.2386 Transcript_1850/m.2386 type:complete len:330 (-) Transcript_1850:25-1014(-)